MRNPADRRAGRTGLASFHILPESIPPPQHILRNNTSNPNLPNPSGPPGSAVFPFFLSHSSLPRQDTDLQLQSIIRLCHKDSPFLVACEGYQLNLYAYAEITDDIEIVGPITDEASSNVHMAYAPAFRRGSEGVLVEEMIFGGTEYKWKDWTSGEEKGAIVYYASWAEGYSRTQMHYLLPALDRSISSTVTTKSDIHALLSRACAYANSLHDEILVFDMGFWQKDAALYRSVQHASWSNIILHEKFKKEVVRDILGFYESRQTYKDLGVPWKRGIIFTGPPGNGKTLSLKALMHSLPQPTPDGKGVTPLYVKSFRSYGGDEMGIRDIFQRARAEAPSLLIIEDIDSHITGGNRSFFLNEVDGLEDNDGILILATTNHVDRLDPGIVERPSRFDRKYEYAKPDLELREKYAEYWREKLAKHKDSGVNWESGLGEWVAKETDGFSFAYLNEVFVSTLLVIANARRSGVEVPDFKETLEETIKALRKDMGKNPEEVYDVSRSTLGSRVPMQQQSQRFGNVEIGENVQIGRDVEFAGRMFRRIGLE